MVTLLITFVILLGILMTLAPVVAKDGIEDGLVQLPGKAESGSTL